MGNCARLCRADVSVVAQLLARPPASLVLISHDVSDVSLGSCVNVDAFRMATTWPILRGCGWYDFWLATAVLY